MDNNVIKEYCHTIKNKAAMGDFASALSLAGRLVYSFPNSKEGYYYRGVCYYGLQQYNEAITNYKIALSLDPLFAKAYFNLASCYQQIRDYDSALIAVGKALILFSKQGKDDSKSRCIEAINFIEIGRTR